MPGEWDWMAAGYDNPLIYNILHGGGGGLLGDEYLLQLLLGGGLGGAVSEEDKEKLKWAQVAEGLGTMGQQMSQRASAQPDTPPMAPSSGVAASAQVQRQQPVSVMATPPRGGQQGGPQQQLSLQQILEMLKQGGLLGGMS